MPILITLVRRYVLTSVGLPLAAKGLAAAGRRVEAARGPSRLSSTLQGGSLMIARRSRRGGRRR